VEAREVEVVLTQLDIRGPDGEPQTVFVGALPLLWQHQQLYNSRTRTIGRTTITEVDLLAVFEDRLQFTLMVTPLNFPSTAVGETHFWVTVAARGLNGESRSLRLRVDWDGGWAAGTDEMARHLIIAIAD
jgi:hypothetical protein